MATPLVFNGTNTYVPFEVSLMDTFTNTHFCGGTIINAYFILTAAHCLYRPSYVLRNGSTFWEVRSPKEIRVVAGQYSLQYRDPTEQIRYVDAVRPHYGYSRAQDTMDYDIGLIRLKTPLRLNKKVTSIPLTGYGRLHTGNISVAGWGQIGLLPGGIHERSDTLRTTQMQIIPNSRCQLFYQTIELTERMLCAQSKTSSLCSGDSGSPAVCTEQTQFPNSSIVEHEVLCGLVSLGSSQDCVVGDDGKSVLEIPPQVLTRIAALTPWIYSAISLKLPDGQMLCYDLRIVPQGGSCCGDKKMGAHADCFEEAADEVSTKSSSLSLNTQFLCKDLTYIPMEQRCNSIEDCQDGSDEKNCGSSSTNSYYTNNVATDATNPPLTK